jgi:hypothetical protein
MSWHTQLTYGIYYNVLITVKTIISAVFWLNIVIGFGKDSFINTLQRRNLLISLVVISSFVGLAWSVQKLNSKNTVGWLTPYIMVILSAIDLGTVIFTLQVLAY